jgi:flavin reductase (DIM6/NTAB) family NADH-FMN oxidoreductase RutF
VRLAGVLALSVTNLSADRPRMMSPTGANTSALKTILSAKHFAIDYLSKDQEKQIRIFVGKFELKVRPDSSWKAGHAETGAPALNDAIGVLDYDVEDAIKLQGTIRPENRRVIPTGIGRMWALGPNSIELPAKSHFGAIQLSNLQGSRRS